LRSYLPSGHPDKELELGAEPTPEQYVEKLVEIFRGVRRVLRADGTLWLNLGDGFYSSQSGQNGTTGTLDGGIPCGGDGTTTGRIRLPKHSELKQKDLIGVPWMAAFALRADGWYLRSDIIWSKPNPMPESVTDRPTKSHEYLFLLTKSPRYFFDQEAVREKHESNSGWAKQRLKGINTWDYGRDDYAAVKSLHRDGGMSGKETFGRTGSRNIRSVFGQETKYAALRKDLPDETKQRVVSGLIRRGIL
jgi:site-specific DNA-methyltransferase (cytosine-N4-specific)